MDKNIQEDKTNEQQFLSNCVDTEIATELESLKSFYKEYLKKLTGIRLNLRLTDYFILANPNDNKSLDEKRELEEVAEGIRKGLSILREQILFFESKDVKKD